MHTPTFINMNIAALHIETVMANNQNEIILHTVKTERSRLLNFIRKRVPSEEDAQDILQDVLYELVETYRVMKPVEKIAAWLFTVARNKITDLYRKKKPESLENINSYSGDSDDESFFLTDLLSQRSDNADSKLIRNTILEAVQEALAELPVEQREVFVMHELEDMSFNEISKITGVGLNTLLSRKRYAVLHLRKKLQHLYDELDAF